MPLLSKINSLVKEYRRLYRENKRISHYFQNGRIPWSMGYEEYKINQIKEKIATRWDENINSYGKGIDERIVEFPWLLSRLGESGIRLLDAGSTLNHEYILSHPVIKGKEVTISTFFPEHQSFNHLRVSYLYEDLRELSTRDSWYDVIACISTIEHIDMNNSIYGYDLLNSAIPGVKSYEYLKVAGELVRVLKPGGKLLLTFPYGRYEHHGFFQQFDAEMVSRLFTVFQKSGCCTPTFFKYSINGWELSTKELCQDAESYNPHTGVGKNTDGAAHSRAICCIQFEKNKSVDI